MAGDYTPDESWGEPEEVTGSTGPTTQDVSSWGTPKEVQPSYNANDVAGWGTPEEVHASEFGSAARRAILEIPSGIFGGAAGIVAGGAAGLAAAPTAPFTAGVGPVAAGLAAGIPAAMGVSYLTHKGQDWVLDLLGLSEGTGFASKAQELADRMENPKSTFTGELAGNILPSFGTGVGKGGAMIGQRVLGGGLQGGMEAAQEAYHGEDLDPAKIAIATGAGAAFAKPRGWLNAITPSGGSAPPSRPRPPGQVPPPEGGPSSGGQNTQGAPLTGEVIPPETGAIGYHNTGKYAKDIEFASSQRDEFEPGDPMRDFWQNYIHDLQSREDGKGGVDVDASLGPASDEHPFTYSDADRANDLTTTALGVAADNHSAPQIEGAGNPVGAPMSGRVAQRPTGALRDYRKDAPSTRGEVVTQESTPLSQAAIHEDVAAALAPEQPPVSHEAASPEVGTTASPRLNAEGFSQAMAEPPRPPIQMAPTGPEQVARPSAPDVTAAVTPQERRVLDAMGPALQAKGIDPTAITGDPRWAALSPKEQAQQATRVLAALKSKSGEATGAGSPGEVRMPGTRPELPSGVTARSKADAARKQGVIEAYDKAVAAYGKGPENEPQGALLDRLKSLVMHADELAGGQTYRPNVKPPAWQLVQAARKVLAKPTPKNIEAYRSTEATLKGDVAPDEGARLNQETARIEGDIERRPQMSDAATEALVNQHADDSGRPTHETFMNENGNESAVYTGQHNQLTNWLNGLSDASHALLLKEHPDLVLEAQVNQDPKKLMNDYMTDLARMQKDAASFEAVPGENAPVVKRTPIKTRSDLAPTEPGRAASAGRVLDKNSPEFKAAAEAALNGQKPTAKYSLEHEEAQMRDPGGERVLAEDKAPVDGTEKTAWDHFTDMMSDESGAARMNDMYDWMKQKVSDYFSPRAADPIKEYGNALGYGFTKLTNKLTRFKGELLGNARSAQFPDGTKPNAAEKGRIYRAMESGETGTLPGRLKDYYTDFVKPVLDKYGPMYDEYKQLAAQFKVPGWEELPNRMNNGNGFMSWVPRIQKGKQSWDHFNDNVDPVTGQTLSSWAGTTQLRDFFALQNVRTGDRMIYIPGEGFITRLTNGAPSKIKFSSNSFDPAQVGSSIKLKRGSTNDDYMVDHATIDEIKQAAGKNTDGTWKMEYHDSPVIAATNALYGLNNALERLRLFRDIVESQRFKDNTTRNRAKAKEEGWMESFLPQFEGTYMPQQWAWAMDDFVKPGFDLSRYGQKAVQEKARWDRVTQTAAKIFYFFGPAVHAMNEADKWIIGRGFNWVTPEGTKSLVMNGAKALKSVWTQDAIQHEMTEAGANPMLMHTLTRNLMDKVARATGDDIVKNASKWDPFARAFGVTTKELGTRAYDASSAAMWWASDVLLTQRYLEEKQLRGLGNRDAVASAHDFVDSYRMPTTVAGSRLAQKFLTDPSTSLFGPYHYGVFHSIANMAKNVTFKEGASKEDAKRAAGQIAVASALIFAAYPALSAAYAKLTGNEESEVERRGISRLIGTAGEVLEGKKGAQDILRNVWTPSVLADTAIRQVQNTDWRGKPILDQQDVAGSPLKKGGRMVGQEAEFLAGQMVSPYKVISGAVQQPGSTSGSVAQKFMESNLGLKTPSDGATRFKLQMEKHQNAREKARMKRPGGLIERGVNALTE